MTVLLQNLIDKQDSFELVRDQIALILRNEVVNQMNLAAAAAKDPANWDLKLFTERANVWEQFREGDSTTPLVNVWFESFTPDPKSGNNSERQTNTGVFNIDLYGYGVSSDIAGGGHSAGDEVSALEVQRAVRLVRNILMSSQNTYLQLQGLVWERMVSDCTVFQPDIDNKQSEQITGSRITLRVKYNEFSPQYEGVELEKFTAEINRSSDGAVYGTVEYDYTT